MGVYTLSNLRIRPEAGKSEVKRRLHKFQQGTVDRLAETASDIGNQATEELRARLRSTFNSPDSTGRTAESAQFNIKTDRKKGVSLSIYIGAFRQVPYMTNLAGGQWHSGPYRIWAKNKRWLDFYWRREGVRFRGKFVKHPGFPVDVPMEVLLKYRNIFSQEMINTVGRGVIEVTAGSAARSKFRATRRSFKR